MKLTDLVLGGMDGKMSCLVSRVDRLILCVVKVGRILTGPNSTIKSALCCDMVQFVTDFVSVLQTSAVGTITQQ